MELKEKQCVPCETGTMPFDSDQIIGFKKRLAPGWRVFEGKKLQKEFPFENFKRGMAFVQDIAAIAERENHHPDICIHYTKVEVELSTHNIGGLSENDFIMAAKIDEL
ncbi:MAG: 4a-hydroxytetrahydrobiopterin dehydratase [Bacteroidales bacterium]|nr:4a-hydroxytetrahydrobiopterin dehydratase [Bacteroidales bacterium]